MHSAHYAGRSHETTNWCSATQNCFLSGRDDYIKWACNKFVTAVVTVLSGRVGWVVVLLIVPSELVTLLNETQEMGGRGLGYQYQKPFFSQKGFVLLVLADRFFNAIFYWQFLTYQDTSPTLLFNSATKIEGVGKFKVWFNTKIHIVLFSCDSQVGIKILFLMKRLMWCCSSFSPAYWTSVPTYIISE